MDRVVILVRTLQHTENSKMKFILNRKTCLWKLSWFYWVFWSTHTHPHQYVFDWIYPIRANSYEMLHLHAVKIINCGDDLRSNVNTLLLHFTNWQRLGQFNYTYTTYTMEQLVNIKSYTHEWIGSSNISHSIHSTVEANRTLALLIILSCWRFGKSDNHFVSRFVYFWHTLVISALKLCFSKESRIVFLFSEESEML